MSEAFKTYIAGLLVAVFIVTAVSIVSAYSATRCAAETDEARVTEALTPSDKYFILTGADLDRFIINVNDLYNIGWKRADIDKVYAIEAEKKSDNPNFQVEHLFFIGPDHCIHYYQTVYKALLDVLLSPKPCKVLGLACE